MAVLETRKNVGFTSRVKGENSWKKKIDGGSTISSRTKEYEPLGKEKSASLRLIIHGCCIVGSKDCYSQGIWSSSLYIL